MIKEIQRSIKPVRNFLLATGTGLVFSLGAGSVSNARAEETQMSKIDAYFCEVLPGYDAYDGGGFCPTPEGGIKATPGTAACGEYWRRGDILLVEGHEDVICADTGPGLSPTQVEIWKRTNKEVAESFPNGIERRIVTRIGNINQ